MPSNSPDALFEALHLPCGTVLKNRVAKAAMSDSLGDGRGSPTPIQMSLYEHWANGGPGLSIVGEVQCSPDYAEKPGNLVLNHASDLPAFRGLAQAGGTNDTGLWLQLGHAGALAHAPISKPKGPSPIDVPGLVCDGMSATEIAQLPELYATTSRLARDQGFGGVEIHAAHGFLLSQFLSPLFNKRGDGYGGTIENRMKLLLEIIEAVRSAVGPSFPVAVKLNATDNLEGGLEQDDALRVVAALQATSVDLLDISGGTYFPGAKSASDSKHSGVYFSDFAAAARKVTDTPLMLTGGFKQRAQAIDALQNGTVDLVGIARAFVLHSDLANLWRDDLQTSPAFPEFESNQEGGVTAWYTMRLTELADPEQWTSTQDLTSTLDEYVNRDAERSEIWNRHFGNERRAD